MNRFLSFSTIAVVIESYATWKLICRFSCAYSSLESRIGEFRESKRLAFYRKRGECRDAIKPLVRLFGTKTSLAVTHNEIHIYPLIERPQEMGMRVRDRRGKEEEKTTAQSQFNAPDGRGLVTRLDSVLEKPVNWEMEK